jgi:excisionase family DNA binding protein
VIRQTGAPKAGDFENPPREFRGNKRTVSMPRTTKERLVATANEALAAIEELPRKRDIAKRYGVSLRTVDRWVNERLIPYIDFGYRTKRFRWADVEKAVNRLVVKEVK